MSLSDEESDKDDGPTPYDYPYDPNGDFEPEPVPGSHGETDGEPLDSFEINIY